MPGVVAWAGFSFLGALGIGAASAGVIMGVGAAVLTLTIASARRAFSIKDPGEASFVTGTTVMIRSTEMPRNIVLGEANVGGLLTYGNSAGDELRSLYMEMVHTGHEIDSFIGWYLDDKYIPIADVDGINGEGIAAGSDDGRVGTNTGGHGLDPVSGTPVLYLRGHLGTDSQAVDSMLDSAFVDIGSNHRHRGCARSNLRLELVKGGESKWSGGRNPSAISAVLRGIKAYDPRADSTFPSGSGAHRLATPSTWTWTDNPALLWARYRILAKPLGPAWATDRIDWQSVFDAANVCDASVAIPTATTEKRFRCDLVVTSLDEPSEVIDKILATMGGKQRHFNGLWHVYAAGWPSTDFTFTEADIIGEFQYVKQPEDEDRYNQVKPTFTDRARLWKPLPAIALNNTTLRTNRDNGEVLPTVLELDGVTREYQAQRLGKFALNQADDTGILVFQTGYNGLKYRVGDTGTVTIAELGFSGKTFRIVRWRWIDFLGAQLTLKEDSSGNYTDPAEGEYSTRTAAGDIVFGTVLPWYLASPSGVWTVTCAFSASDADTVAWGSGSLILVTGKTYSISSGNTGNMSARTYIYFDPVASATVLQTTTTAGNAVGASKILLGVAENSSGPQAFFQIFGGGGGVLSRTSEIASNAATDPYSATDAGPITKTVVGPATNAVHAVKTVSVTVVTGDTIQVNASFRLGINETGGGSLVSANVAACNGSGSVGLGSPRIQKTDNLYEPITIVGTFTPGSGTYDAGIGLDLNSDGVGTIEAIFRDVTLQVTVIKR
jgi:putative tail protein